MDTKIKLIFIHYKDNDEMEEVYTVEELIYGVGSTRQPVSDLMNAFREDGYILDRGEVH